MLLKQLRELGSAGELEAWVHEFTSAAQYYFDGNESGVINGGDWEEALYGAYITRGSSEADFNKIVCGQALNGSS
ncbi:MAG: hypothetical protein H7Z14_03320 [Anaerolineae bacterium]|nr:hypothetical protein [Phycisphaerae bacterium]